LHIGRDAAAAVAEAESHQFCFLDIVPGHACARGGSDGSIIHALSFYSAGNQQMQAQVFVCVVGRPAAVRQFIRHINKNFCRIWVSILVINKRNFPRESGATTAKKKKTKCLLRKSSPEVLFQLASRVQFSHVK
jgi:hypothetical protein